MDKTLNRHVTIQVSGKVVKTMSWTMCFPHLVIINWRNSGLRCSISRYGYAY